MFPAIDESHRADDLASGLPRLLHGLQQRTSGRDDVVDDDHLAPDSGGFSMRRFVPWRFASLRT